MLLQYCDLKLDDDDDLDGEFLPRFALWPDTELLRYSALLPSTTIRPPLATHSYGNNDCDHG